MAHLTRDQRERLIKEGNRRAHLRMCVQEEPETQLEFPFHALIRTHGNRITGTLKLRCS